MIHFGSELVFKDASTYTCIVNLTRTKKESINFKKVKPLELSDTFIWDKMSYKNLSSSNWDLQSEKVHNLIEHLKQQPYAVDDVFNKVFVGMQTSLDAVYVFEGLGQKCPHHRLRLPSLPPGFPQSNKHFLEPCIV